MKKVFYFVIVVAMVIAFATAKTNLTFSLQAFATAVFAFIGLLPYEEGVFNERED